MNTDKIIKNYMPMTETAFYILLSLYEPRHGYGIIRTVEEITKKRIVLGSGTVYGTLTKMHRDGIVTIYSNEERKTVYEITITGKELLSLEIERLKELNKNASELGGKFYG
ncbi:MAG: PadR family transcriptional regulator [Clostridiaceae bacterium]|nr:PadR family transcriptional regulator [Clostridiaceae bacterium]